MQVKAVDILIVGGGPAGLSAAIGVKESGIDNLIILEREPYLGGILNQCIHNGFGLHRFKEEMTGPEYAHADIETIEKLGIPYLCDTTVLSISKEKKVYALSKTQGLLCYEAKAIILAMGCRERPCGALAISGNRLSGVFSAGTAQKFTNLMGLMPGKEIVILGSGDIGLIMARRMTLQGATVKAVVEIMPYSSGLNRNIVQCLNDFNIPLYLSHTITQLHGKDRLNGVTIARVDELKQPIHSTEQFIACDTLLLSVGLIPENELSKDIGVKLNPITQGPIVNDHFHTSVEGVFACGNVLHVHDLVDFVSQESYKAGQSAVSFVLHGKRQGQAIAVHEGEGVRGVVPQTLINAGERTETVQMMFRPDAVYEHASIVVYANQKPIFSQKKRILTPGEMAEFTLKKELIQSIESDSIEIKLEHH